MNPHSMNLEPNDLVLFARVADEGSFSRAAQRLGLPKSTVSRRVAALEAQLGERLLQRTTRKLTITDFGVAVLEHAHHVVEDVAAAASLAQNRQIQPSGRLRVSMPGDLANLVLAPMLAEFVLKHPAITLEIDLSARFVDLIGENFDVAVRMGELRDDAFLAARRVATFRTSLYAAPAYLASRGTPPEPEALMEHEALRILSRDGRCDAVGAQSWRATLGRHSSGTCDRQFAGTAPANGAQGGGHHGRERPFRARLRATRRARPGFARVVVATGQCVGCVSGPAPDAGAHARVHRFARRAVHRSRVRGRGSGRAEEPIAPAAGGFDRRQSIITQVEVTQRRATRPIEERRGGESRSIAQKIADDPIHEGNICGIEAGGRLMTVHRRNLHELRSGDRPGSTPLRRRMD